MIQANELRIGNWLFHKKNWSYRQKDNDLKEFYFQWDERDWYALGECTLSLEYINPIPLTSKILEKCGFDEVKNINGSYELNGLIIHSQYPPPHKEELFNAVTEVYYYDKRVFCFDGCKYLHKLQNLYYILTGKELEIKL